MMPDGSQRDGGLRAPDVRGKHVLLLQLRLLQAMSRVRRAGSAVTSASGSEM